VAALEAALCPVSALAAMTEVDSLSNKGKAWVVQLMQPQVCTVMVSMLRKFRGVAGMKRHAQGVMGKVASLGTFSQEMISSGLRDIVQAY
jgi:hypothetical protein